MTLLQTIACGRIAVDVSAYPAPERPLEVCRGPYTCREYPMTVARVREIKRRDAGEIVGVERV
ncbi:MAG: hypothetical protein A3E01_09045 [Gammaproteobacteria bacterium RIFCSPHIGHO2_12_FULL_63_22]|nr:MAG: hypothetical protein A3E01_09045 [Gammaproteobacteria bacterium RIFCSPHIGHO2_12_FULL_63_22]